MQLKMKLIKAALNLKFIYCDYSQNNDENVRNHNEYVDNVYNLINDYAMESNTGSNLLHRLLLEGRILIEKIEGIKR